MYSVSLLLDIIQSTRLNDGLSNYHIGIVPVTGQCVIGHVYISMCVKPIVQKSVMFKIPKFECIW